jgi:hypothetical protein
MSYGARLSENFGDATGLEDGSEDDDDATGIALDEDNGQDETLISQSAFDRG